MEEYRLSRNNLYMLPTRHGILFTILLIAMLLIAVNYNNSLAYLMTFTLASSVMVSMLYTHRNLEGLCLSYGNFRPVFAGETLRYTLAIDNNNNRDRFDVGIDIDGEQSRRKDFSDSNILRVECNLKVLRRGWQTLPSVQLNTRFPLGLFFSWSKRAQLNSKALVFPNPAEWREFPVTYTDNATKSVFRKNNHDDLSDTRKFQKGDPPQHIDWKAYARGRGLYTKQFVGGELPEMTFRWDDTDGEREYRISLLTRWVIEAAALGINFGLELPGYKRKPANGERHFSACLTALALF